MAEEGRARDGGLGRLSSRFLAVPLLYKIVGANAAILAGGILACVLVVTRLAGADLSAVLEAVGWVAAAGVLVGAVVNVALVRLALSPLRALEETARRIEDGDDTARAPTSPLADRETARLIDVFNRMLAGIARGRERERRLAAGIVEAGEAERRRIARELYDDTGQILAGALLQLRLASRSPEAGSRDRILQEARNQLADALESVRRIARGLRPPELDELGVVAALEALARTVSATPGICVEVRAERLKGRLPSGSALALYRVVQEAVANAVRHAGVGTVLVQISESPGAVVAEVVDEGGGFDVRATLGRGGGNVGLFRMEQRAREAGGILRLTSAPGCGTRVRVEIPTLATVPAEPPPDGRAPPGRIGSPTRKGGIDVPPHHGSA